jgi:hypothetical protein
VDSLTFGDDDAEKDDEQEEYNHYWDVHKTASACKLALDVDATENSVRETLAKAHSLLVDIAERIKNTLFI